MKTNRKRKIVEVEPEELDMFVKYGVKEIHAGNKVIKIKSKKDEK